MHEAVQSLMRRDDLEARSQIQVKGVAEHDFGADFFEILRRHRLDRTVGADRHERRRLYGAAREFEPAAPRRAISRQQLEPHRPKGAAVRSTHARCSADAEGVRNITSP